MRSLLALSLLALLACNPAIDPHGTADAPPADDAGALDPFYGDDEGGNDEGGNDEGGNDEGLDASDPSWEGGESSTVDAARPLPASTDASSAPVDAPYDGACSAPLQAGGLLIDELMIQSVAGTGDDGEWLEVASTLGCATNLDGLHGECAVGSAVHTFDVTGDLWLPPGGTFLVADSLDPAVNHDLPGLVLAWSGHAGDILRNLGGTVTLSAGAELVVSVTWPSMKLAVGTSVELPAGCPPDDANDFSDWQQAVASWFPAFHGTPNAPNLDVTCP
jgi:hypothetical protein